MDRNLIAFALAVTYCVAVFGIRSLLLWRKTGTAGFRGLSGKMGSLQWWGGVGLIVAIALAFFAPFEPAFIDAWGLFPSSDDARPLWLDLLAMAAVGAGVAGTWWAQSSMGVSWRIGVQPDESTALVQSGPFRWVRNPVFTFVLVSLIGFALFLPTLSAIAAVVVAAVSVSVQVRLVEEPYLLRQHGEAYVAYSAAVGRFLPGIGKGASA